MREYGKLFRLPDGVGGEESIAATVAVQKLRARTLPDDLRAYVGDFVSFCATADTGILAQKDDLQVELIARLDSLITEIGDRYVELVERVGEHIRRNEMGWS